MKNRILTLVSLLLCSAGFAQNSAYELPERQNPTVKKESLSRVQYINDLSPMLWSSMQLPLSADFWLYKRRVNNFTQPQPENYLYPQDDYKQIVEVVFTEISVTNSSAKTATAQSTSDKLTAQQKDILNAAAPGTEINVTIKYKYKDQSKDNWGSRDKIVKGSTSVTVVPEKEAQFAGGRKQLSAYFKENVINRITTKEASDKIYQAVVKFTVNEEGQILNARLARTSADKHIDYLLMEALKKMPNWKPAEDSKGVKIRQEISIPFGAGC